jgi:transcription initiation factor TFIIB
MTECEEAGAKAAERCPQCGGAKLVRDYVRGELICRGCGLVVEDRIVTTGQYWRPFEETKRHTGPPLSETIPDRGLRTKMSGGLSGARGRRLSPEDVAKYGRLRFWDSRRTNSERAFSYGVQELEKVRGRLGLPRYVGERAALLYRTTGNLAKGRSVSCVAVATLYIACRDFGLPRKLEEFAAESGVQLKNLRSALVAISKKIPTKPVTASPAFYVNEIVTKLGLDDSVREGALSCLERRDVADRDARKAAATAVYMATGGAVPQHRISEIIELSRVTVTNFLRRFSDDTAGARK